MAKEKYTVSITLEPDEYLKVGEDLYTSREFLISDDLKIHLICRKGLELLKEFEGKLTPRIVNEWILLSRALDQTCNYETKWNDRMIIKELIAGKEYPVSWYVSNCKLQLV